MKKKLPVASKSWKLEAENQWNQRNLCFYLFLIYNIQFTLYNF